jgi:hypothetical protein
MFHTRGHRNNTFILFSCHHRCRHHNTVSTYFYCHQYYHSVVMVIIIIEINSMGRSPSSEANTFLASQVFP